MRELTYLACPYSHPDPVVRRYRFECSNRAAAILMLRGRFVYAPISHTHPIAEEGNLPLGWEFWEQYDRCFLQASKEIVVLTIDGWEESKGVTAEIEIAKEYGLLVEFMSLPNSGPPP